MFSQELRELIAKEFPYPFARAMHDFGQEPLSPDCCCRTLQWTLESMGCILLADYASSKERSPAVDDKVLRFVGKAVTLGGWKDWIISILEHRRSSGQQPFVGCFATLLEWRSRKLLKRLIDARNYHSHAVHRMNVERFHEDLESLYRQIQPLSRYSLLNPHKDRSSGPVRVVLSELLKGHSRHFQEIDVRTDVPLEFERLYLHAPDSRELLALDPWLTYKACEPCAKRHFFKIDTIEHGKVEYSSIPPASHPESSDKAFVKFREILGGSTVERLKPRHISLPGELAALPRSLRPGDRVGPYEVVSILHLGGLSQVYEARDTRSGEHHALKVLPFELSRDMLLLRRFEDELRSIQKLSHPNVIRLIDSGKDQEDRYIVVELARGGKVGATECRDLSDARKSLPEKSIIDLARQVVGALSYIHAQGIIHRDLKPANLLVMGDQIVLTDFGIAWETGEERYTVTGTFVGTPEYMAPEQVRGGKVDARTDLYALGCILYELATGRPPYRGRDPFGTANSHVQATPMRIQDLNPRISRGLSNIILKLLQKLPELRYQSAADLLEHLGKVADDPAGAQVIEGYKTPQDEADEARIEERRRARRHLRIVGASAAAVLLCIISVLLLQSFWKDWKISSLVEAARAAWARAPERPEEAVAILREAHELAMSDERVSALREDLFRTGSLKVMTSPESEVEIVPDPVADTQLDLPWEPRAGKPRFRSGELVRLAVGHYRMRFHVDGELVEGVNEPIYVDHVKLARTAEGWTTERMTGTEYSSHNPSAQEHSSFFYVARHVEPPEILLPIEIPEGQAYVGPGWALTTKDPVFAAEFEQKDSGDVQIHTARDLHWERIDTPFIADTDEVSVREFRAWFESNFEQFWKDVVDRDAWLWIPYMETRRLPVAIHREAWREILRERKIDVDELETAEKILRAVFSKHLENRERFWEGEARRIRKYLEAARDEMPAGNVTRDVARAFARTSRPIKKDELEPWLGARLVEITRDLDSLGRLRSWAERQPADIWADTLGGDIGDIRFRCRWGCDAAEADETPLKAYTEATSWFSFYAEQLPARRIIEWAEKNQHPRGRRFSAEEVEGVRTALGRPSSWLLGTDLKPEEIIRARPTTAFVILAKYAEDITDTGSRKEPIDRTHFLRWIESRRQDLEEKQDRHEDLLARIGEYVPETELDFRMRYEYGDEMGYDIPSPLQWDRMLGGDDPRLYPWGNSTARQPCISDGVSPQTVDTARNWRDDHSPHGIHVLGGNFAEHVFFPKDDSFGRPRSFGKGTAAGREVGYASKRCFLSIPRGAARDFLGFRVVRKLNPLCREMIQKGWNGQARASAPDGTRGGPVR